MHEHVVAIRFLDEDPAVGRLELPIDVLAERDLDVIADVGRHGLLVGSLRDHDATYWRRRRVGGAWSSDAAACGDNGRDRHSEQASLHVVRTTAASASSRGRSRGTLWPASSSMRRPSARVWTI